MGYCDFKKNIDIVFCIDATGSMDQFLEDLSYNSRLFADKLFEQITTRKKDVSSVRIRLILFKDYGCDLDPMTMTDFFKLPEDKEKFSAALSSVSPVGGGDEPENGLESLYFAMKSDWNAGQFDRQVIVLFTDAEALDLKERDFEDGYPEDMVDIDGLIALWNCEDNDNQSKLREKIRRLIVYAPAGTKYKDFCAGTDKSWFHEVRLDGGLMEVNFDDVISEIIDKCWFHDEDEDYIMLS